ncbi:MAG: cupin domain-containing protein [Hyphomicrobiaceae bacterium]
MQTIDHNCQNRETWRAGVETRMRISSQTGSQQICVFEQWCEPGFGAPTHLHAVEEILTIFVGEAHVWLADAEQILLPGQSIVVPAGQRHGFRNMGNSQLHVQAILAAPIFEAAYDDGREAERRWLPTNAAV